jgi:hypothetical protein
MIILIFRHFHDYYYYFLLFVIFYFIFLFYLNLEGSFLNSSPVFTTSL